MENIFAVTLIAILCTEIDQADSHSAATSHVTGAVRIKRSNIPEPVSQCLVQNSTSNPDNCPHTVNNWSDVHCIDNSFGLYTPQSQFMSLGAGPLGINLNHGLLQTVSYLPVQNQEQSQEKNTKFERMIEEKAKLEVKVAFFESRFSKLEAENEQLNKNWQDAENKNNAYLLKIHNQALRLSRWEAGTIECKSNTESEQKKTSTALQIAFSHISQLEKENVEYIKTNKDLEENVNKLRTHKANVGGKQKESNVKLTTCKTKLSYCEDSQRETALLLEQQTVSDEMYATKAKSEYIKVINQLEQIQVEISECTASLDAARDRNDGLQKSRDVFISRLSKSNTLLEQCNGDLQHCHSNHSLSSNQHDACQDDIDKLTDQLSRSQKKQMACTGDLSESTVVLQRANERNTELRATQVNIDTQLQNINHQNIKLEKRVLELVKQYYNEQAIHKTLKSDLRSCQAGLSTNTEIANARIHEIADATHSISKLNSLKEVWIKEREMLAKELAVTKIKLINMKSKQISCQKQINKFKTQDDKLLSMTTKSQAMLSTLKTMYAVVVSQRDECTKHKNASIQKLDDWKDQYMDCDTKAQNTSTLLLKCQSKHNLIQEKFKALEQEAQVSLNAIENLSLRVSKSTNTIADLTNTLSKVDTQVNALKNDNAVLAEELEGKTTLYLTTHKHYTECSHNYNESRQTIIELEHTQQFSSELMDALKKQANDTSFQLMKAQASLYHQQAVLKNEKDRLFGLKAEAKYMTELRDNEQNMKAALHQQLELCRSNHTEVLTEAQDWQRRLENCRERVSLMISNHQKELQKIEKNFGDLTEENEHAAEVQGQMKAAVTQCNAQKTSLQTEKNKVRHILAQCGQKNNIYVTRIRQYVAVKTTLEQKIDSCSGTLRQYTSRLQSKGVELRRCMANVEIAEADKNFVSTQLKRCNAQCKDTSLSCPEGPDGEVYIVTSAGCLLQTTHSDSATKLEKYCSRVKGQLLTLQASDENMRSGIMNMLKYSGAAATRVWVTRPDHHGEVCFSVDISKVENKPIKALEYIETPCDKHLPGLCFSSLSGMGSLETSFDYEYDMISSDTSLSFSS